MNVAMIVTTYKRFDVRARSQRSPVNRAVLVVRGSFGEPFPSLIRLKTRTICLTDPSLPAERSNPSLTIDGRAVKILADEDIALSAAGNDPLDWEWERENESV